MNWHTLLLQLNILILVLIFLKMNGFKAAPVSQNYFVIIDAGSSGSRMFVYTWQTKAESSSGLEDVDILKDKSGNPIVKKQTPGLSSFADKTSEVPAYISSLLDSAVLHIPLSSQPNTQLFIMATAGMRLLSSAEQDKIWKTVRHYVASTYRFQFRGSNAYTISGSEEGLFGWIAVNYLLGRFRPLSDDKGYIKQPTDGMLDMGGASMQIAYELQSTDDLPDNLVSEFSLSKSWYSTSQHYKLYVKSYLGFGMNAFRHR
ncbi:Ectonucleoside triphosphate diphosphohydrolase 4 [Schistosoma japonicum]|nr:Ectonucleoside triphosphate diphosphohydrolase 4 [Schistosoma japonicum]